MSPRPHRCLPRPPYPYSPPHTWPRLPLQQENLYRCATAVFPDFYLIWTEHSLLSVFWTANATAPCRALFCVYVVPFLAIFSFPFHYSVLSFERREWRLPMGHAYDLCVDTTLAVNGSAIDWQWRWFHCRCRAFEEFSPFSFVCHSLIPTSSREKSYSHYNVL